jgi:hypothetical protein
LGLLLVAMPSNDRENPEGALFCMRCGAKLTRMCTECGTELLLDPDVRYCFACGAPVAGPGTAAEEPGTVAARALRRLAPREFAERLLARRGHTVRERRIVWNAKYTRLSQRQYERWREEMGDASAEVLPEGHGDGPCYNHGC